MPRSTPDLSRRSLLTLAAAGATAVTILPRASAAPLRPLGRAATTPPPPPATTLAELEANALALTPPVFLLETAVPSQFSTSDGSPMSMDNDVHHTGDASLRWDYQAGSRLEVTSPLILQPPAGGNGADIGAAVNTMAFWLYQSTPSSGTLRIEVGRGSGTDAWAAMHLDFTGWRTAWIRYEDLNGKPRGDMDTLRFVAPTSAGTLHLDYLILNNPVRSNYPTRDRQVPFVNPGNATDPNEHWLDLLWFSGLDAQPLPAPTPTAAQLADLAAVEAAYTAQVGRTVTVTSASVDTIAAAVDALGVPATGSTGGGGRAILGYQNAIWPTAISADLARLDPEAPLQTYTNQMFTVASAYTSTTDPILQGRLADLYVRMLEHLWDQGWDDGSSQGTIHHLGYQARGFYTSVWLVRDLLAAQGLLEHAKASLAWLVGFGRTRQSTQDANRFYNGIMDIINTTLIGMLGSALMADTDAEKVARVQLVQTWLDNASAPSPGTQGGFKPDRATFHHMGHYPAYSRDALAGGSPALLALSGTGFAVSQETHQRWTDALLGMRFYTNKFTWPVSLSNRHPTGSDGLNIDPYQFMTQAGSPDGTQTLDPVMGAAFLRLLPANPYSSQLALATQLAAAGVVAEPDPTGCEVMNHAALVSHRRDDWLVSVRGHNRYLWSTEMYYGSNMFGRYVTYGNVQVLSGGDPVSNAGSGFVQPGWDWNRYPGTTAIQLPFDQLVTNIDTLGEEMLLTDQRLGGGGTIEGQNGAFLMSLHENAEYDGSFHARKSVFLFDNRVVALGTGIVNKDRAHSTQTTLFQCYLADQSVPTVDSRVGSIASVPYSDAAKVSDPVWLVDPQNVGYYVPPRQQLVVSRAVQTAPDQGATTTGSLPYAIAVLDHGTKPRGGSYEYALVVGATPASMTTFAADMRDPMAAPYTVLRRDQSAHVVYDRATQITGCAVFEPTRNLTTGLVRAVDTPSVVLVRRDGADLVLSVTDPDLRFYDGPDRSAPTASPFGVPWRDKPSQPSQITVELDGRWIQDTQVAARARRDSVTTRIVVHCANGLPTELRLTPA